MVDVEKLSIFQYRIFELSITCDKIFYFALFSTSKSHPLGPATGLWGDWRQPAYYLWTLP